MRDADDLTCLLDAWREDIESVPFPTFAELLIPAQKQRIAPGLTATASVQVTKTTGWCDR
ncbi:hypothetical protein [Amycolatopsis regifaucium]|uniref:Uncharacterized protein n=1 Tax=Amycolatopsis regifaucium TaxID=546365 RepID=A0A154MN40_9PSEU|nr:hypothetical protein [Amycolatopsis regifaucium]KZB85691.1 hypothetical protein AVL48_30005 [Amycolatopsis regifaucium]OKA10554.1 hypothetical protein ATP06_0203900 [Amycolatopsis regifaucium]SFI81922.1 hypothetical protein SAMN04489731_113151 [Amycolatopsis regifaucium]